MFFVISLKNRMKITAYHGATGVVKNPLCKIGRYSTSL